jgi:hypothetical protein
MALMSCEDAAALADAGALTQQIKNLVEDARALKRKAEHKRDLRTALMAVRELCRLMELLAKMNGEIARPQHNSLHVHLDNSRAEQIARTFLDRQLPATADCPSMAAWAGPSHLRDEASKGYSDRSVSS